MFVKPRPGNKHHAWLYGEVIGKFCTVNTSMGPVRKNHTQIREAKAEQEEKLEGGYERSETVSSPESELKETDQPVEQERTGLEVIKSLLFYVTPFNKTARVSLKIQGIYYGLKKKERKKN